MFSFFSSKLPLPLRFELIARGELRAKTEDFKENKDASSLIHYACLWDNLKLFHECVKRGQSASLKNFWGNTPLYHALKGKSFKVLKYLVAEYNFNLSTELDTYGQPLWWSAFDTEGASYTCKDKSKMYFKYGVDTYFELIDFLKEQNVDFNQRANCFYKEVLANKLIFSYKYTALYALLKRDVINVDIQSRMDHLGSLAHTYIEDSQVRGFIIDGNQYIEKCFEMIYSRCDLSVQGYKGNVVDELCKSGQNYGIRKLIQIRKISLNAEQNLWLRYISSRNEYDFDKSLFNYKELEDKLFYKKTKIDESNFYINKSPLVVGLHDKEINKGECVSLKELKQSSRVSVPYGAELFKN